MAQSLTEKISKQLLNNDDAYAAIMVTNANRLGLNVRYVHATAADGNCFYHALVDQIHRDTILDRINPNLRFGDHYLLRLAVVSYVRQNQFTAQYIQNFRRLSALDDNQWEQILMLQERNGTFASAIFCHTAAIMLNVEIKITTLTSTEQHPTYALNSEATSGATMILSNITNFHFQSLVPCEENVGDFEITDNNRPRSTINNKYARKRANTSIISAKDVKLPRIIPITNKDQTPNQHLTESEIKDICVENNVIYIQPQVDEASCDRLKRITSLRRKVYRRKITKTKVAEDYVKKM